MSTKALPRRRLVSMATISRDYEVAVETLRQWISTGKLAAYRVGGRSVRIDLDEFESLVVRRVPTMKQRFRRASSSAAS